MYAVLFLCLGVIAACDWAGQKEETVCLVVGDTRISPQRLKKDMSFICAGMEMPAAERALIKNRLLDQCINHYLLLEYAEKNDIMITEIELRKKIKDIKKGYSEEAFEEALLHGYVDLAQWERRLKEQLLITKTMGQVAGRIPPPTYQDIKTYYESNPEAFMSPKMVDFRQIVTLRQEKAETLLKRIKQGESLSALASAYSVTPEAENGGRVGWLAEENLDASMRTLLSSLPLHQVSPVVKTPYGYHIFEVLGVRPAGKEKLSDNIDQIRNILIEKNREAFLKQWLEELRSRFKVEVNQNLIKQLGL